MTAIAANPVAAPAAAPAPETARAAAAGAPRAAALDPEVERAARGLEGVFMSMLVDEMFKGTEIASAQPVYGGMMTRAFGDALAESGGIGLAAMLVRQMEEA